ncbi:MAG TPA: hypothetical protein VF062_04795 [Candidatus Limnocylindrales bacterium]
MIGLLLLSPWIGEYLLGNVSARELAALPFLVPLYGGGALLIRETVRRTGRGWPSILLLGAAYGVIEAGLVDQSLFNPSFDGHEAGYMPGNALSYVVGHAVWSIAVPIAIMEMLTRSTQPWLGRTGLVLTVPFYLLGCAIIFSAHDAVASPGQLVTAAAVTVALIAAAFVLKPLPIKDIRWVPRPWQLGIGTFLLAGAHIARPENWTGVALDLAYLVAAAVALTHWSRSPRWGLRHGFAVVAGAALTYCWTGFVLTLLFEPGDPVRWAGNATFAVLAIVLLVVTFLRVQPARISRATRSSTSPSDPGSSGVASNVERSGAGQP